MSDSLLSATMDALVRRIGDRLPAAYTLDPGEVRVGGDVGDHTMPEDGAAVRWPIGDDEGFLVVAVTADAAEMLRSGPPETTLVEALTLRIEEAAIDLAAAFEGIPPMLGEGEEIGTDEALASGPGDAVSVALDDAGTLRATIGLRLVVSDALMAPPVTEDDMDDAAASAGGGQPLQDDTPRSAGGGVPLQGAEGVIGAGAVPLTAEQQRAAAMGGQDIAAGMAGQGSDPEPGGNLGIVGNSGGAQRQRRTPMEAPMGEAHPANFASFDQLTALPGHNHSMSLLGDVELGVTAELGRTELTVRDVLGLSPGSIIELDRAAGSPVDVVVNGTLIARGEVVVIDEEFGIRITEILGMADEASPFPMAQ